LSLVLCPDVVNLKVHFQALSTPGANSQTGQLRAENPLAQGKQVSIALTNAEFCQCFRSGFRAGRFQ
jgi:hypothetical protein